MTGYHWDSSGKTKPNHVWLDEHDALLREMATGGSTATQIACRMGEIFGASTSRCSVIGRASRIGIEFVSARSAAQRNQPGARSHRRPSKKILAIQAPPPEPVNPAPPAEELTRDAVADRSNPFSPLAGATPLTFDHLDYARKLCRWPVSGLNEKTTLFCGAAVEHGSSYCACHRALSRGAGTSYERRAASGIIDGSIVRNALRAPRVQDVFDLMGASR